MSNDRTATVPDERGQYVIPPGILIMTTVPRSVSLPTLLVAALAIASCKGAEKVCQPTDPLCNNGGGGGASIASIEVSSPIGTVMAVGRTAQMSATATDTDGGTVTPSPTFSWSSTVMSVATVNGSGLVSASTAGTTDIEASADVVTGSLTMRAVDADLAAISTLLGDAYLDALVAGLAAATASTINGHVSTCQTNVTSGNILAIRDCLADALAVTGADGTDTALLAVLALYFEQADRHLGL
jgi:hypothetical protein